MTKADTASLTASNQSVERLQSLFQRRSQASMSDPETAKEIRTLIESIRKGLASMIYREERRQKRRLDRRMRLEKEGRTA